MIEDTALDLAPQDAECEHCGLTPVSGAWGHPCPRSPDRLHWTSQQRRRADERLIADLAADLCRAPDELATIAGAIRALPARQQRKLPRALDPDLIRNEAERGRDTLHVFGLWPR